MVNIKKIQHKNTHLMFKIMIIDYEKKKNNNHGMLLIPRMTQKSAALISISVFGVVDPERL